MTSAADLTRSRLLALGGAIAFFVLATANAGGYRYGASDQAYYVPAIRQAMDPSLFPRDAGLLAAQSRVIVWDGLVAGLTRMTGLSLPWTFFLLYVAGVLALYSAALWMARAAGMNRWGTIAFLAILTLRHRIARTGVNTLEGYLHPRMIAFALGLAALAAFVRRRPAWAAVALAVCGAVHPTTGVWFAMLAGVAAFSAWPAWRRPLALTAAVGTALTMWAVWAGPLAPRAVVMDAVWLSAISQKDYLFPHEWPAYAWMLNLLPAAIVAALLVRHRGLPGELRGLLWGALILTAFFLVTLPFVAARYALAVQLQIPRVFWLVELVLFIAIGLGLSRWRQLPWRRAVVALLVAFSVTRGATVLLVEKNAPLVRVELPESDWADAMGWLQRQPSDTHELADPGHAWRYGTSVRVSAERDVFLEDVKDAAIAMYDRDVAARVVERRALTHDLGAESPAALRGLAERYGLDYLVTDAVHALPVAYQNGSFRIYALSPKAGR